MKNYALVTGSADRIGRDIAIELAKKSYNLLLHYNSSIEKIKSTKEEIEKLGVNSKLLKINFLEENNFNDIFQNLKNDGINIEILINCASDFQLSTFKDEGSKLLNKELKINFESPYLLTKAFANIFSNGHIINLLDTKIEKNSTNRLDYILSKKLLRDFTLLSAVELAPNFKVNAIAPGLVLPPEGKNEDYLLELSKEIPLKTIGNLEDVLKALHYLLESSFVTGQILYIDGGDHLI